MIGVPPADRWWAARGSSNDRAPRVLIVDPDRTYRCGVRALLTGRGYLIVGETGSGRQAEEIARRLAPDVVLLELVLADGGGLECAYRLRLWNREIHLIVLTKRERLPVVPTPPPSGLYLSAFVWKNDAEGLLDAVREACASPWSGDGS